MNLLIVTGIFPPDTGGPASYVPRIATELVRRSLSVEIVCWSDRLDHDDTRYPFSVHRIKRSGFRPWRNSSTVSTIARKARDKDLVYVNGLAFESTLAAYFTRRPTVHKVVGDQAWEQARNRGWFKGSIDEYQRARKTWRLRLLDWMRTFPLQHAQQIIVPSMYLKRIVAGWGPFEKKITVIYNAACVPALPSDCNGLPPFSGTTLMAICRLVPWKGVDELILLVARLTNTRLVIVGDGPLRHALERQAHEIGVGDRVMFVGQISRRDITRYLAQSDVFVLNSTYEGLPHVVLEAMAAGVPVVATDVGGTGEVVQHLRTGILVPPGDLNALKEWVVRLSDDRAFAGRLVEEARNSLTPRFSLAGMVRATELALAHAAGIAP
jgi:glycosyltransferase involved in cell wall biosynthesis